MIRWLVFGIWGLPWLAALVWLAWLPPFVRPDPLVWPVVFLGLFARDRHAVAYVVVLGLLRDAGSAGPFAASAISWAIAFQVIWAMREHVVRASWGVQLLLTAWACVVVGTLDFVALRLMGASAPSWVQSGELLVAWTLPTVILAPAIYAGYRWSLQRIGNHPTALGDYAI